MPHVEVRGKRVFYTTGGRPWEEGRRLVLFVHGAGGSQTIWVSQSRSLAHHSWNTAAVDLPGHGRSADLPEMRTVEDYAGWLAELLAALAAAGAGGSVVLVGHSLGAAICMTCAAESPQRVAALVLLGTRAQMEVHPRLLADTKERPRRAAAFISAYGHGHGTHFGGAPVPGAWLLGSARALVASGSSEVLHRDFRASHEWRGEDYARRVQCPTLVVVAAEDRMTPAKKGRELAATIPGAEVREIGGAGHFMMMEAPRPVLQVLQDFLGSA